MFGKDKETESPDECPVIGEYNNDYTPLSYLTSTVSLLATVSDKYPSAQVKKANESHLLKYYNFKRPITYGANAVNRHGSVVSESEQSNSSNMLPSDIYNSEVMMNLFLNCAENRIDPYQLKKTLKIQSRRDKQRYNLENDIWNTAQRDDTVPGRSSVGTPFEEESDETYFKSSTCDLVDDIDPFNPASDDQVEASESKLAISGMSFSNAFRKYYKRLLTVNLQDFDILKRHNMWVPTIRNDCKDLLVGDYVDSGDIYDEKTCPLFIRGLDYIPSVYDIFSGCSTIRSVISEYKFPALTYHCAIELNRHIFMIGGLIPCYRFDNEAPDLSNFYVDGIKNLPPPLLAEVINNPAMVNNPHLYVISLASSRLSRPRLTGHVPPPIMCMVASQLNDRYILFYGGFEIKTETKIDKQGKCYLKKRAFLNNTVYILDTIAFKFVKAEINGQSYDHLRYPTFSPRFGHLQLSATLVEGDSNSINTLSERARSDSQRSGATVLGSSSERDTPSPPLTASMEPGLQARKMSPIPPLRLSSNGNFHMVHNIIIFGGYRQTGDDKYEAMNDMWKLEVKITARGKRSYLAFADTITALKIPIVNKDGKWPNKRAFFAYSLPDVSLVDKSSLESDLLQNLQENFRVEVKDEETPRQSGSLAGTLRKHKPRTMSQNSLKKAGTIFEYEPLVQPQSSELSPLGPLRRWTSNGKYANFERKGRTIVIHGGSDNTKLYGDMWWFDLDSLVWSKIQTYVVANGEEEVFGKRAPTNMSLVGHSMTNIGCMAVLAGGLSAVDVKEIYSQPNDTQADLIPGGAQSMETSPSVENEGDECNDTLANGMINIIDLSKQCIRSTTSELEERKPIGELIIRPDPTGKSRVVVSVAGAALESDGTVFLVGGVAIRRENLKKTYLRGALLEFVLPSVTLAS
ncbi:Gpb1p KNAG_0E00150 [Huiozyma naganishii CBS 8797]|uniref:Uncharacterized protein n=1 Tax=Huiozyma naganishii (strain ATCC MYA-139 / BCRC 22969 / CBS 8797 / KCTC 17520 / NBRC 10181 / NCYC 3082 / Yp74L-3) TaxID=1071383 RepID=J7RL94_HUIN7|nr:hypothetical protein KNAG_0E00150 [Kazachstania naganishii CBS 8797]CCK70283.1 hypothetical protein KNAG_0E00150 [Kazachstania naganishii CBS 8797]